MWSQRLPSSTARRLLDPVPATSAALGAPEVAPEEIVALAERAGLRGRGGAGYPTAAKLRATRAALAMAGRHGEAFVLANGYDADPASPLTATLLERQPSLVLDGITIAARAVGAARAFLYLHPGATATRAAAEAALRGADLAGLSVEIALGPGGFAGGEESIALAVLESRRAMARQRPPYPATEGYRGRPTLVQSVETLACLALVVREGADAFRASGTAAAPGTKLVSVTGAVARPGVYEVAFGTTLGGILDLAGAADLAAIHVGGPTGGLLGPSRRDVALGYEELRAVGTQLGSGQVRAVAAGTCAVAEAGRLFAYLAKESCAICVPCRVGTRRVEGILGSISSGLGRETDLAWLTELGDHLARFSLCGFGITAPQILRTTMAEFPGDYRAHIAEGRCPAGTCAPTRARRYETMVQP